VSAGVHGCMCVCARVLDIVCAYVCMCACVIVWLRVYVCVDCVYVHVREGGYKRGQGQCRDYFRVILTE